MKDVAPEDRPKVGQWVNDTRTAIETIMEEKMKKLEAEQKKRRDELMDKGNEILAQLGEE